MNPNNINHNNQYQKAIFMHPNQYQITYIDENTTIDEINNGVNTVPVNIDDDNNNNNNNQSENTKRPRIENNEDDEANKMQIHTIEIDQTQIIHMNQIYPSSIHEQPTYTDPPTQVDESQTPANATKLSDLTKDTQKKVRVWLNTLNLYYKKLSEEIDRKRNSLENYESMLKNNEIHSTCKIKLEPFPNQPKNLTTNAILKQEALEK